LCKKVTTRLTTSYVNASNYVPLFIHNPIINSVYFVYVSSEIDAAGVTVDLCCSFPTDVEDIIKRNVGVKTAKTSTSLYVTPLFGKHLLIVPSEVDKESSNNLKN